MGKSGAVDVRKAAREVLLLDHHRAQCLGSYHRLYLPRAPLASPLPASLPLPRASCGGAGVAEEAAGGGGGLDHNKRVPDTILVADWISLCCGVVAALIALMYSGGKKEKNVGCSCVVQRQGCRSSAASNTKEIHTSSWARNAIKRFTTDLSSADDNTLRSWTNQQKDGKRIKSGLHWWKKQWCLENAS